MEKQNKTAIGVLGGSVSSCHGLDATTAHPLGNPIGPNCYPHRVFAWLNDVFPHPANELTNGACEFFIFLFYCFILKKKKPNFRRFAKGEKKEEEKALLFTLRILGNRGGNKTKD